MLPHAYIEEDAGGGELEILTNRVELAILT